MTGDCQKLRGRQHVRVRSALGAGCLLSLLGMVACGSTVLEDVPDAWDSQRGELGVSNGLATNGLATNGLATNGLATNGLATNGLSTSQFTGWFDQSPVLSADVMKYVVRCALPAGSSLVWTHPQTGIQYTWEGALGLAPDWALGRPAPLVEQQLISACLGALTNKYGLNLSISVLGRKADGTPIPQDKDEFLTYSEPEACFFGNLFTGAGLFAANNATLSSVESSARACGLEQPVPSGVQRCPPMVHVGRCRDYCVHNGPGGYYLSCIFNGVTYRPLTTRLRRADIYRCGDGVCQFSESCGTGLTPDSCVDCGPCP